MIYRLLMGMQSFPPVTSCTLVSPRYTVIVALTAVREFVNKSAASAASPDYVKFQAVIKSAASPASREPKSRGLSSRGAPDGGSAGGRRPRGAPLGLGFLDLAFGEAALAADLITA